MQNSDNLLLSATMHDVRWLPDCTDDVGASAKEGGAKEGEVKAGRAWRIERTTSGDTV